MQERLKSYVSQYIAWCFDVTLFFVEANWF